MPDGTPVGRISAVGTAGTVAVTILTAVAGGLAGDFDSAWYRALRKPRWQPPGAVIGAVWTVLYTLLAISGSLLWRRPQARRDHLLVGLFGLQYLLNAAFTPLLTKRRSIGLATLDSGLLALTVAILISRVQRVRRSAAVLLLPYALWASFATVLSARLRQLNPSHPSR